MSTRCQIAFVSSPDSNIDEPEALIYRHSDGYPSGVLPDVMPFLEWWSKNRGIADIEYCSARLLQWLCNEYDGQTSEFEEKFPTGRKQGEFTGELGHGICKYYHGDIEYLYVVQPQGVVVFETSIGNWDDFKISECVKKLGTIPFTEWKESEDYKKLVEQR